MYQTLEGTDLATCPTCHNKGYLTVDVWAGQPTMIHCNKCGHSFERKK